MTATVDRAAGGGAGAAWPARLWDRELPHYPDTGPRMRYLGITVVATVVLYYELYIQGAVATKVISDFGFSFTGFVAISILGNAVGAFASLFAGLADRWGRANLVVIGLLLTGLLIGVGLPNAGSKAAYTAMFALVSLVEGVVLVATPALIRDFSPQVDRAQAMGFWTLGPVLGSLVVTEVSSQTLDSHPDWRWQFDVCGVVGLVVFVVALLGLRELSPRIRDQLMVSLRDRALVEARAAGLDPEKALQGHWRQMMRFDVLGPAFAISIFLLGYYVLVGFVVVYFATVHGYSEQRANALANWYWITNAIALVVAGVVSDRLRVRKPLMVVGTLVSLVGNVLFALATTRPSTSYHTFALYFVLSSFGGGVAYVAWMAAYTETVERHNPAATATGLAVWGWILRIVVTVALFVLTLVVPATSTLVDKGPRVQQIAAQSPGQVATLQSVPAADLQALQRNPADVAAQSRAVAALTGLPAAQVESALRARVQYADVIAAAQAIDPATLAALKQNPFDPAAAAAATAQIAAKLGISPAAAQQRLLQLATAPQGDLQFLAAHAAALTSAADKLAALKSVPPADLQYLAANGAAVAKAQHDNPAQWQRWWWIAALGQVLFLPFVFVLAGRWSPRRAREDELAHERLVAEELAALERGGAAAAPGGG